MKEKNETLELLSQEIRGCDRCRLASTRKHALPGEGDLNARLMFIALSPGYQEDLQNRMFVGPSGSIFDKLLNAAGLERRSIFMTNLIKCVLPGNRKPEAGEIESCSYYLKREIAIIKPLVIVPLGYFATRAVVTKYNDDLFFGDINFRQINGQLLEFIGMKIFPLTHPSALLYKPSYEYQTIKNFEKLKLFAQ
jgi:DNA polymerase